jgi:hypothetical protein
MIWAIHTYENISVILFKVIVVSESCYTSVASQNFINSVGFETQLWVQLLGMSFWWVKKICTRTWTHDLNLHETCGLHLSWLVVIIDQRMYWKLWKRSVDVDDLAEKIMAKPIMCQTPGWYLCLCWEHWCLLI